MPCDLSRFDLPETLRCGREVRHAIKGCGSLEEAAQRACISLYESLYDREPATRACALVRCYKTHAFGELPPALQTFAQRSLPPGVAASPSMKCLVLLGTAGEAPGWNSRRTSERHQAIPLPSVDLILQAPMIAKLFRDMGVELGELLGPAASVLKSVRARTYGVFHVETAEGSPAIPAQEEFVVRHRVRSVVGFGGELPGGDMFATILFSKVPVPPNVANRFRNVALDMKSALFAFGAERTFAAG